MSGQPGFDLFITDLFNLYLGLERELRTDRVHVAASSRRALAALRAYSPEDDGEAILLEIAIEEFEDLLRRAAGRS